MTSMGSPMGRKCPSTVFFRPSQVHRELDGTVMGECPERTIVPTGSFVSSRQPATALMWEGKKAVDRAAGGALAVITEGVMKIGGRASLRAAWTRTARRRPPQLADDRSGGRRVRRAGVAVSAWPLGARLALYGSVWLRPAHTFFL